ncbi:MAG: anti-sigma factor [Actinomycetota bacterium]
MIDDHERIEELLAGYVLQGLSGDDAREADGLLTDHVPGCARCRRVLDDFQSVTGELGFAATPADPPDTLLPRLRKALRDRPVRTLRPFMMTVAAAMIVAVGAMAGWNVLLRHRVSDTELARSDLARIVDHATEPGSTMVSLHAGATHPEDMLAAYDGGEPQVWIVGVDVPPPAKGNVYRIWLNQDGDYIAVDEFWPDENGWVERFITFDLTRYDELIITEEPADVLTTYPAGRVLWAAAAENETPEAGG